MRNFKVVWTEEADRQFKTIFENAQKGGTRSKSKGLAKQVQKALARLQHDPKHPGLNVHRYDLLPSPYHPKETVWEAYVQNNTPGAYRIFWCYGPNRGDITILAITPHP